jgi:hypothetical protein
MSEQYVEVVTRTQLEKVLPKKTLGLLTDDILETLNNSITDENFREIYRDNLLGFASVINEGKYKLQSYIDAVRYVSFVCTGSNGTQAYAQTFPDRYQKLVMEGATNKTISSYATTFKKTQLVQKIFEQQMIPVHIFNHDIFQKAINVQANLMVTANSEKVRTDAANSLLNHLKPPEIKKIELDVGQKQDKTLDDLRAVSKELAEAQLAEIKRKNITPKDIAASKILKEEIEDGDFTETS